VRELLKSAASHFRDVLELKVGADNRHANDDRWRDQAAAFPQDRLVWIIDVFSAAEKDLKWNEQHRLALEMALLKAMIRPKEPAASAPASAATTAVAQPAPAVVAAQEPVAPQPQPVQRPVVAEPAPRPEPAPAPAIKPQAPSPAPAYSEAEPVAAEPESNGGGGSVTLSEAQREWQKVLRHVGKVLKQPNVAALAREGRPIALDGSLLTVGFSPKWSFHMQKVASGAEWIQKAYMDLLGVKLKVTTMLLDEPDPEPVAPPTPQSTEPVAHPLIDDVLTTFGGTVVNDEDSDPWEE
jgi:DNA polymerase III gamma/tau subunit